ncbi:sigma-70 family RNA polymerase sigma factor, partial [Enterococcus faecalis]|nr:sigma-70 family RNA polymerase sigma factor [Enterococcus faecalis]
EKIINPIAKLKEREKYFLLEKFLFGKTDKEIGRNLNITRQAVTNLKHRAYAKVRNEYNR